MHNGRIGPELRERIRAAWPEILAALAAGEIIGQVLARLKLTRSNLTAYMASETGARQEWEDARDESAHALYDEALEVARNPGELVRDDKGELIIGKDGRPLLIRQDPALARTRIDTLKWAARIRNPRLYGDRASLDVNVKTVDLTRIISEANARLQAQRAPALELKPGADGVYSLPPELLALL